MLSSQSRPGRVVEHHETVSAGEALAMRPAAAAEYLASRLANLLVPGTRAAQDPRSCRPCGGLDIDFCHMKTQQHRRVRRLHGSTPAPHLSLSTRDLSLAGIDTRVGASAIGRLLALERIEEMAELAQLIDRDDECTRR